MKPVLQLLDEFAGMDGVDAATLVSEHGGKRMAVLYFRDRPLIESKPFGTFEDALADLNKKLLKAKGRGLMLEVPQGTKGGGIGA